MTDDPDRHDPTAVLARRTFAWLLDAAVFLAAFLVPVIAFGERFTSVAIAAEPAGFRFPDGFPSGDATLWFPKWFPAFGDSVLVVPDTKFWLAVGIFTVVLVGELVFVQGLTGRTLGKALFRIRCVTRERPRPGIACVFLRSLAWIIDLILIVILPLAFILASFTKGHRRLGDLVSGTFVVDRSFAATLGRKAEQGREDAAPAPEPEPEPAPDAAAEEALVDLTAGPADPASAPVEESAPRRSTEPVWDETLETYVRWEPSVEKWIGWDESAHRWRVVDQSRRG